MRLTLFLCLFSTLGTAVLAQEPLRDDVLRQGAPAPFAPEVQTALNGQGFRIQDGAGRIVAEIWLRKTTSCSEKPSGPKGSVQFPFLADGEMLGVLQFASEARDYRDQSIAKGVYTVRYGLQPVNGDH